MKRKSHRRLRNPKPSNSDIKEARGWAQHFAGLNRDVEVYLSIDDRIIIGLKDPRGEIIPIKQSVNGRWGNVVGVTGMGGKPPAYMRMLDVYVPIKQWKRIDPPDAPQGKRRNPHSLQRLMGKHVEKNLTLNNGEYLYYSPDGAYEYDFPAHWVIPEAFGMPLGLSIPDTEMFWDMIVTFIKEVRGAAILGWSKPRKGDDDGPGANWGFILAKRHDAKKAGEHYLSLKSATAARDNVRARKIPRSVKALQRDCPFY